MNRNLTLRFFAVATVIALLAGGCVDESEDPSAEGSTPTTESDTPEQENTADDSADGATSNESTGEADSSNGGAGDVTDDVTEPLTASDRGVSETTITLGIPALDIEQIKAFGLLAGVDADEKAAWESAMANVNERGGIHGRTLEVVYALYLPLGVAQADAACVELVDDNEIFAAIGTLIVPESVLCYAEFNGTPFVGAGDITDEIANRSVEAVITTDATVERLITAMIDLVESEGQLDRPIAVHGDDRGTIESAVQDLRSRGANVVSISTVSAPETDVQARVAEFEGIFERWRSDDAEVVVNVGTTLDVLSAMGRQEFYIDMYAVEGGAFNYQADEEREYEALRHITLLVGAPDPGQDHGPTNACHESWDSRNPDKLLDENPDQLWITGVACAVVEMFAAVATAAGPELTHESFSAARDTVGTVDVATFGEVRVGGDGPTGPSHAPVFRFTDDGHFLIAEGSVPLR